MFPAHTVRTMPHVKSEPINGVTVFTSAIGSTVGGSLFAAPSRESENHEGTCCRRISVGSFKGSNRRSTHVDSQATNGEQ